MKRLITGTIITIIIGGTAYTISQTSVVKHFAADTGMTQQQAEQYINTISEDELVPYDELGLRQIDEGQKILDFASNMDCVNYEYTWESASLTCYTGKAQLKKIGEDTIALGQAYKKLGSDSASKDDISKTIELIDIFNDDYNLSIARSIYTQSEIDEIKRTNSFNKAMLKAAIESN